MKSIEASINRRGGLARTRDLLADGHDPQWLRVASSYGRRIIRVRKGWWATRDTHPLVIDARRAGGRLACLSALAMFDGSVAPRELHIEVERHSSRRRIAFPLRATILVHRPLRRSPGNEATVTRGAAVAQAAKCRGLSPEAGER